MVVLLAARSGWSAAAVSLAAFLTCAATAWTAEITADERIVVEYPPNLSPQTARAFAILLAEERRRVRAWWGETFEGDIRVKIQDERRPSMALVPAWRGERGVMLMPLARVKGNDAASLHEIVHIYAPNANRFLAEGLAVYAQEHLKGRRAHPNAGRDLHEMASDITRAIKLTELDTVPTPRSLGQDAEPVGAYVAGGSFVRFLIEQHGLEKFRQLYALTPLVPRQHDAGSSRRWSDIYGRSLAELEADWRRFLDETQAPPAKTSRDRRARE